MLENFFYFISNIFNIDFSKPVTLDFIFLTIFTILIISGVAVLFINWKAKSKT